VPAEPPAAGATADLALEHDGCVPVRRAEFERRHRHGDWRLDELEGADPDTVALLARDPTLASVDLTRAIFLDTETSGLSGGAGTWVFLVGLGAFEPSGASNGVFRVWQGFLAEPALELDLLQTVADRIRAADLVVSFFGKSFDRHRLEDKMRLHGIEPPFPGKPHLDLYHPLRRLYRSRAGGGLEDGRLRTFERDLCAVEREDDLPGSLAPAAWFDFLHGREHDLEGVFRHNQDDVLSLVTLAAHLARTLVERRADGRELSGPGSLRARAIARLCLEARRDLEALDWFQRGIERGGALPEALAALHERARRRSAGARVRAPGPLGSPGNLG